MKRLSESSRGITLIALIMTVVIMLILAGVAISAVVGGDGLFGKVTSAKIKYEEAARVENELIQNLIEQIDSSMNGITPPPVDPDPLPSTTEVTVKMAEGMVPVTYNESDSSWYVATEDDILNNTWYEYVNTSEEGQENQSKWANVMLRDNLQVEGVTNASTAELKDMYGKKVTSEGSMYVWIPRYAYKIPTGYHTKTAGEILIEFLNTDNTFKSGSNETLYLAPDETHNASNSYILHPAFKWAKEDGTEVALEGIWVGKFEASSANASFGATEAGNVSTSDSVILRSVGNVSSWRSICNHNMFLNCYNINSESNASKYGISTDKDKIDPHMMKNSEWGAAAYLAHSAYGRNGTEVTMNSTGYITGNGNYKANVTMSTTGNVYGIYDMAGGTWEHTAAYVDSTKGGTVSNESLTSTSYGKAVYDSEDKYKDVYVAASTDNRENNYNANTNKYGDAVYETSLNSASPYTSGWYGAYTVFPFSGGPFFFRGGGCGSGANAGVFAFSHSNGVAYNDSGFRVVLATL